MSRNIRIAEMKRDPELIRKILFEVEECPADKHIDGFEFDGYDEYTVALHAELLIEAGFLDGEVTHFISGEPPSVIVRRLTWPGHDFIDAVRDETVWKKIRENVLKPTASWTFGLIIEYAKAEVRKHLGI